MKRHKGNTWEQDKAIDLGYLSCRACNKPITCFNQSKCLCQIIVADIFNPKTKWNGLCMDCECGCDE